MSDTETTTADEAPKAPPETRKTNGAGALSRFFGPLKQGARLIWPGALCVALAVVLFAAIDGRLWQWPGQILKVVTAGRAVLTEPVLPGVLSIEPPQLYTRERLVNDRFRQANWLEQQLAKTKNDQLAVAVSRETRTQSVTATMNSDGTGQQNTKAPQSAAAPVVTSALQELSAVDKMRLRLRTDLMDTLLDDGHDLEGNTLYRLNFDAVVMPLINRRSYPGTAVFIIEARDPYAVTEEECTADPQICETHKMAREQKRIADDVELLRGWQREIQQFLTKVLDARIEAFQQSGRLHNPVDPKENIALDWFLRRELISSFLGAVVYDPEVLALCREEGLVHPDMSRAERLAPGWATKCKNWVAQTIGFAWSAENPVPTVKPAHALAPLVEAGFRKAIRRSHYINTLLAVEGQMAIRQLHEGAPQDAPPDNGRGAPLWQAQGPMACAQALDGTAGCVPQAQPAPSPPQPIRVNSMPQDEDYKRALVRLISVWQTMEQWAREKQFGMVMQAALMGPTVDETPASKKPKGSAPAAEFRLLSALSKFETGLPTEDDVTALRQRVRGGGAQDFLLVQGQAMPHPQLRSTIEQCGAGPEVRESPAVSEMYKCLMMRSEAAQASSELLSRFLLARLQEELTVYDRESRSIRDFLDISLEGCSTTGCRIQVSQHRDLPGNEVLGAREAGFLPPVQKFGKRALNDAMPASFYDIIGAFKAQDGGLLGETNWQSYLNANCVAKNLSLRTIRLTDDGLNAAKLIVDQNLSEADDSDACIQGTISYETRKRLQTTRSCLGLAERHADNHEARTEIYLSCMLRDWINTQRSDVTVYAVSPRAGDGDDLTHRIEQASARVGAGLPAGAPVAGALNMADSRSKEEIVSNPRVIGFSHLPGSNQQGVNSSRAFTDRATFGWAIRPRRLSATGGYQSSHHRLSAVISLPSWWKRVDFDVRACWVQPQQVNSPAVDFTTLCKGEATAEGGVAAPEDIMLSMRQFRRHFEIKLPRRVEEITSRFNFDFIRAPYYYREFDQYVRRYPQILSLEAGRAGKLVLQGERLWRGTVVTVNNQSADSIVVLPDMKGVVAHFDCVHPPDGAFHFVAFEESIARAARERDAPVAQQADAGSGPPQGAPGSAPSAPLFIWTSEGGTTDKEVTIHPFVQRWQNEKPCWLAETNP